MACYEVGMFRRVLFSLLVTAACTGHRPAPIAPGGGGGGSSMSSSSGSAAPAAVPAKLAPLARLTKVRTVEGITEYRMDNGMQVLLFPDPTQSTVTVNITYFVGSRLEGYGETGMAHLLEHMLFKGTPKYRNVMKLLDAKGAQLNGTTWTDRTNYFETLTASQENLDFALDLEADRMINALIAPEDLKTEFSVVRNEFEMGENDPSAVLNERITSTAFLWHNYGKSTIGSRADIERVPVPALRAFYQKYYQPDNAMLVVAGKFDEKAAIASIEKTFGAIPKPTRQLPQSYTVEPQQDGERDVVLRRNGDIHLVAAAYHVPGAASPDYPAIEAAVDMLTREPSGRLYKKLVETKLAASIDGDQSMFRDPFLAYFQAEIRDAKNVDKVQKIILDEIEKLGSAKIDPKEVERWKLATLKELELAMADSQRIAVELSEFAALGDWRSLFAYRDRVGKVTPEDVQRVAKTFFKQSNRTTGRFVPTKDADRAPHVETPDIQAMVKGIEGGEVKEQGEAFVASLDNIEARTTRKQLANGIAAAFLPKKTRGGKVELQLQLHWGDEKTLQNKLVVAMLAAELLERGTTKKTYQDIQDQKDVLKAKISIEGAASGYLLRIETVRDKLAGALDLGAEMLTSPSFPDKQLELVKQETLAALEQQLQNPDSLAFTMLSQLTSPWPKSDPRYTLSPAETIALVKKVTMADIRAFYKTFVGGGHAQLAVVGDFDPAAVSTQVEKLFGTWKSRAKYTRLADKPFGVPAAAKTIDTKDKEMAVIVLGHDLAMKDTDPDYPAFLLVGHMLGGDTSSRIWMRVREKEGLSYGAGAWATADAFDESGSFGAYAIVAPQNLAKAKASILDEIAKMADGKTTPDELQRTKDSWIKAQDTQLSDDSTVTFMLRSQLYRGRTTTHTKELRAKLQAVTPADIERVAKRRLDPKRLVIVDAGDLAKAKAPPAPSPKP